MTSVDDWCIVIANGLTMLGRPKDARTLEPVYTLECLMQMVQRDPRQPPQLMTARSVKPLLTFASLRTVTIPPMSTVIPCSDLSTSERRELAGAVDACEQIRAAMRAQESGLVLAPADAMPRRQG